MSPQAARRPKSAAHRTSGKNSTLWKAPRLERVLEAVFAIGRRITFGMTEQELVTQYGEMLHSLFPGRALLIRKVAPSTVQLTSWYRRGRLRTGALAAKLVLRPAAVTKMRIGGLDGEKFMSRVGLHEAYERVFEGTCPDGVAIPLVARGRLHGVVNIEYPKACKRAQMVARKDEQVLIPLANQLAVALDNEDLALRTLYLRDYLAKLIEEANALILAIDANAQITVFNRGIAALTGFLPKAVLGRDLRAWAAEHGRMDLASSMLEGLAGRTPSSIEIRLPSRDGTDIRATFNIAAIATSEASGRIEAVVAIGQDATRIKALEHQIIQSEKLATLGQLAAGVVHELNNPLTSITVYADYLVKKLEASASEPVDVERARRILEGAERILRFTRDLVTYARPSGEEVVSCDVNEVVTQSLSFCEHVAAEHRAQTNVALGRIPRIAAVKGQLQQVFINLITNACHALQMDGGRLWLSSFVPPEGGVCVQIRDDGCGIASHRLPHIFEPFFTTKTEGKGTGLGLSIVKNIVEHHGGRVEVRAAAEGGTLFSVFLPIEPPFVIPVARI